mmetsp:Transcript_1380/g.2995  ORF Transcript_1380/g.2995 Transcript_1380/m.2995 type:complete len:232 (-) Transcript_1380:304-999(-)
MRLDCSGLESYLVENWDKVQDWFQSRNARLEASRRSLFQLFKGHTCAMCLQQVKFNDVICQPDSASGCHHFFHWSCVKPWLDAKGSCPTCRREVWRTPIHQIHMPSMTCTAVGLRSREEWLGPADFERLEWRRNRKLLTDGFKDPGEVRLLPQDTGLKQFEATVLPPVVSTRVQTSIWKPESVGQVLQNLLRDGGVESHVASAPQQLLEHPLRGQCKKGNKIHARQTGFWN